MAGMTDDARRRSREDQSMSTEPESVILELLRQMRADLASKADLDSVRPEVAEMKSGLLSLRIDVPSDLSSSRKELSERIVGLRRAVIEFHTSVIGWPRRPHHRARGPSSPRSASTYPRWTQVER
jgi:hypothetical protein